MIESIFIMLLIWGGFWLFGQILGKGTRAVGAAAKTLSSGGSFADNYSNKMQFKVEKLSADEGFDYDVFGIYAKGNPEVTISAPIVFIFKLYDKETSLPVLSTFEETAEAGSRIFEHTVRLGDMADKYYPDWARLSALIPEALIGPHKGTRHLELKCFIWYESHKPIFKNGHLDTSERSASKGGINIINHEFSFRFSNSGYMEIDDERLKIQMASVKLAISIALADGSLDQKEGKEIKKWIKDIVKSSLESQKDKIKEALNNSLEEGFKETKHGSLDIKAVCSNIKSIGSKADKYDLLELCLDVMAADGEADQEELKQIAEISDLIGIDYEEVTKLKDQRLIKLNPASASMSGLEEKLGIDPDWDKEKINKHIISLWGKWAGRITALPEGNKRDNAQKMLDLIAEARKKYS